MVIVSPGPASDGTMVNEEMTENTPTRYPGAVVVRESPVPVMVITGVNWSVALNTVSSAVAPFCTSWYFVMSLRGSPFTRIDHW